MNDDIISSVPSAAPVGLPSIGELLRSSWTRYQEHWKLWVSIMLPAAVVGGLYAFLMPTSAPGMPPEEVSMPSMLLLGLVLTVVQFLSTLALLTAVNAPLSLREAYGRGARLLLPYLFIGILSGVVIGGGFLLFIVPGILFALWFGLAPYILISENTRGMNALLKSKAYVEGYLGAVLGRVFVLMLIAIAASVLLSVLPEPVPTALITLVMVPFATIYCSKIYEGLKQIKGVVPETYGTKEKLIYIGIGILGIALFVVVLGVGILTLGKAIFMPQ